MPAGALKVISLPALALAPPRRHLRGAPGLLPQRRSLRTPIVAAAGPERLARRDRRRGVQHDWRAMSKQATWLGGVSAAVCYAVFWSGGGLLGVPWVLTTTYFVTAALAFKYVERCRW